MGSTRTKKVLPGRRKTASGACQKGMKELNIVSYAALECVIKSTEFSETDSQDGAALAGCRSLLWLIFWVTVSTFSFTSIPDSCRNR